MLYVGAHFGHAAFVFERSIQIHRQHIDIFPALRSGKWHEKHILFVRVQRDLRFPKKL